MPSLLFCAAEKKKTTHEALFGMFAIYSFSSTDFMELKEKLWKPFFQLLCKRQMTAVVPSPLSAVF